MSILEKSSSPEKQENVDPQIQKQSLWVARPPETPKRVCSEFLHRGNGNGGGL